MKKILLFSMAIFCILKTTYASELISRDTKNGSMVTIEKSIAYKLSDIKLDIRNTDVKFREDDEKYTFIVNQDLYGTRMLKNYINSAVRPNVALTSFDSIENLRIDAVEGSKNGDITYITYRDAKATLGSAVIARWYEQRKSVNGEPTFEEEKFCSKTFYLSDLFGYTLVTKNNFDQTPHDVIVKKTFTYDYIDETVNKVYYKYNGIEMNIKYEITMNKNDLESYRYLSTYIPELFKNSNDNIEFNKTFTVYNLCSPAIDLMQYVEDHTHDFKITNIYKDYHEEYCEGCDWTKKVIHEYINAYDGIEQNECVCKKHKFINIHIDNNVDNEIIDLIVEPYELFPNYEINKTGNTIKKILIEEKIDGEVRSNEYNDLKNFELPYENPNVSTNYHLIYDINNYKIKYNNKNNLYLLLDKDLKMDEMDIEYNERVKLAKNIYNIKGYDFIGWCDSEEILYDDSIEESEKVKYKDEEIIFNITSNDNDVINLYPIFKKIKYKIVYYNNINQVKVEKEYDLFTNESFPDYRSIGVDCKNNTFMGWYYNDKRIKKTNTSSILENVKSDGAGNGLNQYILCKFSDESSGGSSDSGGGSSDYSSDGPIKNNNNINIKNLIEPSNDYNTPIYSPYISIIDANDANNKREQVDIDKKKSISENNDETKEINIKETGESIDKDNNEEEGIEDKGYNEDDIKKDVDNKDSEVDEENEKNEDSEDIVSDIDNDNNENGDKGGYTINSSKNDIISNVSNMVYNIKKSINYAYEAFFGMVDRIGENNIIILSIIVSIIISLYYAIIFIKDAVKKKKKI